MKSIHIILAFLLLFFTQCSSTKNATAGNANLQQLINSKSYTFLAQYALPLGGRSIPLTTQYTLTVKGDSLISDLPYFGRAFTAPINPSDGGIHFTSTNFNYTATPTRKGGYNITISPHDEPKANGMTLSVTSGGYANLQVISTNRQSIAFRGIIQAAK